jgi:hypothetical protein
MQDFNLDNSIRSSGNAYRLFNQAQQHMRGQLHGECMDLPKHIFTASGSGCLIYPPSRHGENKESIESPREVAAQTAGGNGMPLYNGSSKGIKVLDVSSMDIIFRGKVWNHMEDPCAKSAWNIEGILPFPPPN